MEKEKQRVPVSQAAKELGMAPQGVREYMKHGLIDIGEVLPSVTSIKNKGTKKTLRYHIYRDKLDKQIGKLKGNMVEMKRERV